MAGFKTHITVSTLAGIGYGAAAYSVYHVPPAACILAGGLCSVSGMLPDIDSGPGRPLRESLSFAAAVVSTMLVDRFQQMGLSMESIILAGAFVYLLVRFGLAELLRLCTTHRGMFHSIPAALIFGEVAFLLASGDTTLRCYKAGGVVLGYLSHLILDELYSVHYVRGRMTFKRSFGTALKLFGHEWLPTATTYAKLALLTFLVLKEPGWMQQTYHQRFEPTAEEWASLLREYSTDALAEQAAPRPEQEPAGPPNQDSGFTPNRSRDSSPRQGFDPYPDQTRTTQTPSGFAR